MPVARRDRKHDAPGCAESPPRDLRRPQNLPANAERRIEFRIGVNLGDVMADGEQICGDDVNVAARIF